MSLGQQLNVTKNDIIFFEGDTGGRCFYVVSGLVRIFNITDSGKESIFFLRRPGEFFGLSEVLDAAPRKANAQALAPSVLYSMDSEAFDQLLSERHTIARRIVSVMGSRIRYLGEQISNLSSCNVMHRLAKLLVYLVYDLLPDEASWRLPVTVPVRISQDQMASMTGSTQPTVSDLMQQFQKLGLISVIRRQIRINDPLALLMQAEDNIHRY